VSKLRLGIIGSGTRAAWIASCVRTLAPDTVVAAVADPDAPQARRRLDEYKVPHDETKFYASADSMLEHADGIDGVIIGTRCDLHAPIAVKVAPTGLPVFLEKPVAISADQLRALRAAYVGRESSVVVSFPLRVTPLFQTVLDVIRSGQLGTINQVQAVNYVPYGGVYFAQWYRDYDTTGGLWLQKATHDFDYINQLMSAPPTSVVAASTRKVYGGDMPEDLHCSTCPRAAECPESPAAHAARDDDGGMGKGDHACVFSESIRHHDAGSAIIFYADGTHATYNQNFLTRRSAESRGARVTGYLGTLEFDWCDDSVKITEHHGKAIDSFKVSVTQGHSGGDGALAQNFIDVMRGVDVSHATLEDGIRSAAMCLAARESEQTRCVEHVVMSPRINGHDYPPAAPRVRVSLGPTLRGALGAPTAAGAQAAAGAPVAD
jgi:predicted dehydrogenase